jgi:PAS domain S-box-containing protein
MSSARQLIVRGGECGKLIRTFDWSATELGSIQNWPIELVAVVNTMLNSPLAMVLITNTSGLLIYNDAYADFAGAKHPAIMGMHYAKAWPEVAEHNQTMITRIADGESVALTALPVQLKRHGKLEDLFLDLNYSPIYSIHNKVIAMLVTVVDVTPSIVSLDQQQAMDEMSLINKTITENTSTALFIMDHNFKATYMNPAAVKMTGFTLQEIEDIDKTLHDLIHHSHPDGRPYDHADCPINLAMSEMRVISGGEQFIRRDGSYFPVFFAASPIPQDGKFGGIILEVRDVTETEQLKELNQAKDDFIAMASHQLRTPATAVKQYLGILMQEYAGPVNEDQLQYLQTSYNANERQLTIIDDLLKTARVDMKGFKLHPRTGNLSSLVRACAVNCNDILDSRKQTLHVSLPKEDLVVLFDRIELGVCIDNLLENASKYSPAHTVIKLSAKEVGDFVEISVKDSGVGVAPADQRIIFEKFTRINNTLSDTVSGNGLGLYWVKRIIDLHKGSVKLTSELGKGSTFTIRLPL